MREQVLRGVSVDLGEVRYDVEVLEEDEDGFPERVRMRVTQGSIAQCTVTPFAAFPSAYIVLDDGLGRMTLMTLMTGRCRRCARRAR